MAEKMEWRRKLAMPDDAQGEGNAFVRRPHGMNDSKFEQFLSQKEWEIIRRRGGESWRILREYSVELSDAQKEASRLAVSGMEKTVERYTGERVTIDPSMIHSLSDEFFSEVLQVEDNVDGKAFYDNLGVGVCIKPYSTPMSVAARTYHELGHFCSFQRSSVLSDFSGLQRENDGLTVFSEKRGVLGYYLTEGVVETLTRRFILEARNEPVFERERQILERQFPNAPKYAFLYMSKNGKKRYYGFGTAYDEAVRKVTETVEDIYQKHKDAFSSSEEVFGVFAKSLFTGRKLELARLIDSTYGKGSFRALLLETEG